MTWTRLLTTGVSALALIAGSSIAIADDDTTKRAYLTANGLLNRGLHDLAADEYRRFLAEHPDHASAAHARYGLAVCLYRLGQIEASIAELSAIPTDGFEFAAETLLLQGHSHIAVGKPAVAADHLRALMDGHPGHQLADDGAALLAESLYRAGQHGEVERVAAELASKWPESPLRDRTELFWGLAEVQGKRYTDAANRFDAIRTRSPGGPLTQRVTLLRAQCLHNLGDLKQAALEYARAASGPVPDLVAEGMHGQAQLHFQQGEYPAAGKLLDQMIESNGHSRLVPAGLLLRAQVWFEMDDTGRTRELLADARLRASKDLADDVAYWSAKCDMADADLDSAVAAFEDVIKAHPSSSLRPEMLYDLGVSAMRAERPSLAVESFHRFVSEFAEHALVAEALLAAASVEHQRGNFAESQALCEQFATQVGEHPLANEVAFLYAENLFLAGDAAGAETTYSSLTGVADSRTAERATFRLGLVTAREGRYDEAEPLLQRVTDGPATRDEYLPALLALGELQYDQGRWQEAQVSLNAYVERGADQARDSALLKLGLAHLRLGQTERAVALFSETLEEHPDGVHALHARFERAQAHAEMDQDAQAQADFEAVLSLGGPDSRFAPHALNHLGALARASGDDELAAEYFGQAAASGLAEIEVEAMYEQGVALLASGEPDAAVDVLSALIEAFPDASRRPEAEAQRVIALARADRCGDALAAMDILEPGTLSDSLIDAVEYERAWCQRATGDVASAASTYRLLLEREPESQLRAYVLLDLSGIEMDGGRFEAAADHLAELTSLIANQGDLPASLHEQAAYRSGATALRLKRFDQAIQHLDQFGVAHAGSELIPSAAVLCAEALAARGLHERAAAHLERVLSEHPESKERDHALLRLGESRAALRHWEASRAAFTEFQRLYPKHEMWFQAQFGSAWALQNLGKLREAIEIYREVVERHRGPTAARAQFQIGEALFGLEEHENAATELLRVDILYAYPEWSAAALYEAGRCFEELGRTDEAREQYRQVTSRFSDQKWASMAAQRLEAMRARALPGQAGSREGGAP